VIRTKVNGDTLKLTLPDGTRVWVRYRKLYTSVGVFEPNSTKVAAHAMHFSYEDEWKLTE
jgi:hypothetical protein